MDCCLPVKFPTIVVNESLRPEIMPEAVPAEVPSPETDADRSPAEVDAVAAWTPMAPRTEDTGPRTEEMIPLRCPRASVTGWTSRDTLTQDCHQRRQGDPHQAGHDLREERRRSGVRALISGISGVIAELISWTSMVETCGRIGSSGARAAEREPDQRRHQLAQLGDHRGQGPEHLAQRLPDADQSGLG